MSYHDCTDCPIFASAEESQAHKMMMEEIDKKIEDRRPTITKQLTNATRMQPCSNSLANALSQHAEDQDSSMDEDDEDGEVQNQLMRRMMQHSSNSLANALSQPAEDQYSSMDEDDEGGEVQNHPKKIDCDFCEKKLAPSSLNRHKKRQAQHSKSFWLQHLSQKVSKKINAGQSLPREARGQHHSHFTM